MAGMNKGFDLGQSILDAFQRGPSAADALFKDTSQDEMLEAGDTGWIPVGSTRVKEIRWVPTSNAGFSVFEGSDASYVGNLFVRFIKRDTAYVYRQVGRPTSDIVYGMGQAGQGIGSYINSVLNGYPRDYCTDQELVTYFGGYGGTYRGPGTY